MTTFLLYAGAGILIIFAGRLLIFRGPHGPTVSDAPKGIIDMHCHTAGIGAGGSGAWISEELRGSWKFGLYLRVFGGTEKSLKLHEMTA